MTESESVSQSHSAIAVGCAGLPQGLRRNRYFEQLRFLESPATFTQPPKLSVLRKWRSEAPANARFAVQAWQLITHAQPRGGYVGLKATLPADQLAAAGHFRDAPIVRDAVARTLEAAAALEAEAIVFRTPADMSPSASQRDVMRRFFTEQLPAEVRGELMLVWEPTGLWTQAAAAPLAKELGLVLARDPLAVDPTGADAPPPAGKLGYFRISGMGSGRKQLDDHRLELLADEVQEHERAWVVFCTPEPQRDAVKFKKLLASGY